MPIYTYRCENCGIQFERRQKFSDAPITRCPECSKKALRKVYQPVGIVYKGSGFYSTDHRSPSGTSRTPGSNKSSEDESTPKTETKTGGEKTNGEKSSGEKTSEKKTDSDSK
jgi:putative FmdB family regulatory protein